MHTKSAAKTITRDPAIIGPAIHPGQMLKEEFLEPLGLSQKDAAQRLGISLNRLNELVLGKRGMTADTAWRLSELLGTTPQFWLHLQADWDLHEVRAEPVSSGRRAALTARRPAIKRIAPASRR